MSAVQALEDEEATQLKVIEKSGDGLVPSLGQRAVLPFQSIVVVPGLPPPTPDLHHANALLQKPACEHELAAMSCGAVFLFHRLGLIFEVERLQCLALHAVGHVERFSSGLHGGGGSAHGIILDLVGLIQGGKQIVLFFQRIVPEGWMAQVFEKLGGIGLSGIEVDSLG